MMTADVIAARVAANLARIREQIAAAAIRAGRAAHDITLIGVSKYVAADATRALVQAGCGDLGEARPQLLWEKAAELHDVPIRWHLIGHWQRNKVRRTLPHVFLFHAGDSLPLLEEIDREAARAGRVLPLLLEVNISGEATKHGFTPESLRAALPSIAALRHIAVQGLMGMASLSAGPNHARHDFARLRALRDQLLTEAPPEIQLTALSMGMSGDFADAIQEGATHVRVGSALWEGLDT
jgi:pyridoxal phosphate enzyme (YggS family)